MLTKQVFALFFLEHVTFVVCRGLTRDPYDKKIR